MAALAKVTTRFGELMGIKGLPSTYDGYLELLDDYEPERFAFDPANTAADRGLDPDRPRAGAAADAARWSGG